MLIAFQRAYKKKAFSADKPCPVSFEVIEIQILKPAFIFNTIMQFTKQTIGHVVPVVLNIISQWNRMTVTNTYRKLCDLLIIGFQRKFAHEINSPVYAVASLFVVSKLKCWLKRTDS